MTKNTIQALLAFFNAQYRLCCTYADQSECKEEYESWREEIIAMRAYRNYLEWCVL